MCPRILVLLKILRKYSLICDLLSSDLEVYTFMNTLIYIHKIVPVIDIVFTFYGTMSKSNLLPSGIGFPVKRFRYFIFNSFISIFYSFILFISFLSHFILCFLFFYFDLIYKYFMFRWNISLYISFLEIKEWKIKY